MTEEMEAIDITWLPLELHVEILSFLPAPDLHQCALVCTTWASLLHSPSPPPAVKLTPTKSKELSPPLVPFSFSSSSLSSTTDDQETTSNEHEGKVWKRRAQRYFATWLQLLPNVQRDCRWLCRACDNVLSQNDIARGFTGLGCIEDYQAAPNAPEGSPIAAGHNQVPLESGGSVVGSVKYLNIYVGEFSDGQFYGAGMLQPECVIREPPHGPTTTTTADNEYIVAGYWRKGVQHGHGTCMWMTTGARYTGQYKRGFRHGKGTYQWSTGDTYRGRFKHNHIWGRGTYTWSGGTIEGGWKMNKPHGACRIEWTNGCSFEGTYKYGMRTGTGTYRWSDGGVYCGGWNDSVREGPAVMTFANGIVFKGTYLNDQRNGPGTLRWPDGDTFEGHWVLGGRHGSGTFTDARTNTTLAQQWTYETHARYSRGANKYPKEGTI